MNPFEKILERLEKERKILLENNIQQAIALNFAKGIVQEVAEEYNGGWIPCSERLPEEAQKNYLVTYRQVSFGEFYFFTDITYLSTLSNCNKSWEIEEADKCKKVIAWQPLPEPYIK